MTELSRGDVIELEIVDINNLGNGVGRYPDGDGIVVFVRGAVSGERVQVSIIKKNSGFCVGKLEKIIRTSPLRADEDFCSAPLSCGGCVYRHISYEHELLLKQGYVKNAFAKVGLSSVEVLPTLCTGKYSGYRNKAQFPVGKNKNGIFAGFYATKTHTIIPIDGCSIQNENFAPIVHFVCRYAEAHGWSVYDEKSGRGLLRHIYLRVGEATGEIMLCLVINADTLPDNADFVREISERFPKISAILVNKNKKNTNVVLGDEYVNLFGEGGIHDNLCGLDFFITPDSFYQVNREGAQLLYETARKMACLGGGEILLDLYCGTGTIGLSMSKWVSKLGGIEIVASAVECARKNAENNGITNAKFLCADAGRAENILALTEGVTPDVVVIDPPRKGSTRELAECLAGLGVPKIVYVSCDADTLARDCTYFCELGYTMSAVQPVDMFPRTGHVEAVCLLYKTEITQKSVR